MGYKAPTKSKTSTTTSAIDGFTGFQPDPFFFNYKKEIGTIGEAVDFRILDLAEKTPAVLVYEARKCMFTNTKDNKPMELTIAYPGDAIGKTLVDRDGKNMTECKSTPVGRLTVWVYGKHVNVNPRTGVPTEYVPINKLMFMEWGPGLLKNLNTINAARNGFMPFNPQTGRPDYDIQLVTIKSSSPSFSKNYELTPKLFTFGADGIPTKDPHVARDAEDVLADFMDDLNKDWDTCIAAMRKVPTVEEIKRQFAREAALNNKSGSSLGQGFNAAAVSGSTASEAGTGYQSPSGYSSRESHFQED